MHCVELAELSSLLSRQAAALFLLRPAIGHESLTRYWIQSRQRLEQWHQGLAQYLSLESAGRPVAMQVWWSDYEPMLEEVIVTESLTRVFAAIGMGLDAVSKQREIEPVTHSIHLSHLEARNRVLQLLLFGRGGSVTQSMGLNRLRRASERWTDRLLAPIVSIHRNANCYANDPQRCLAYVQEWQEEKHPDSQRLASFLTQIAMRTTLAERTGQRAALPNCNREVARSILACLSSECFDSLGLLKDFSTARLSSDSSQECQPDPSKPMFPSVMPSDHSSGPLPHAARWLI